VARLFGGNRTVLVIGRDAEREASVARVVRIWTGKYALRPDQHGLARAYAADLLDVLRTGRERPWMLDRQIEAERALRRHLDEEQRRLGRRAAPAAVAVADGNEIRSFELVGPGF